MWLVNNNRVANLAPDKGTQMDQQITRVTLNHKLAQYTTVYIILYTIFVVQPIVYPRLALCIGVYLP